MKRIIAATAVAAALAAGNAQAGNTSGTFNVNVTLTSSCTLGAVTDLAFAYTSLQAGASAATGGGFSVSCTSTLPYTFGLQSGNGAATPPGAATIAVSDNAVNLNYSLGLSAAGGTGNGAAQAFSVTGTMAGGQAGTCAVASCTNAAATNKTHTLIVNY
jgi:spore coat protein U domain-containing protein, fimbrial subunit CupE1/2/3/6